MEYSLETYFALFDFNTQSIVTCQSLCNVRFEKQEINLQAVIGLTEWPIS